MRQSKQAPESGQGARGPAARPARNPRPPRLGTAPQSDARGAVSGSFHRWFNYLPLGPIMPDEVPPPAPGGAVESTAPAALSEVAAGPEPLPVVVLSEFPLPLPVRSAANVAVLAFASSARAAKVIVSFRCIICFSLVTGRWTTASRPSEYERQRRTRGPVRSLREYRCRNSLALRFADANWSGRKSQGISRWICLSSVVSHIMLGTLFAPAEPRWKVPDVRS
jgi:hypothetical protein